MNSGQAGPAGAGVVYEEVGMGLTSMGRCGQEVTSQPLESTTGRRATQLSVYAKRDDMLRSHGTPPQVKTKEKTRPGLSRQLEESYSYVNPIILTDSAKK